MQMRGQTLGIGFKENYPAYASSNDMFCTHMARKSCREKYGIFDASAKTCRVAYGRHFGVNNAAVLQGIHKLRLFDFGSLQQFLNVRNAGELENFVENLRLSPIVGIVLSSIVSIIKVLIAVGPIGTTKAAGNFVRSHRNDITLVRKYRSAHLA